MSIILVRTTGPRAGEVTMQIGSVTERSYFIELITCIITSQQFCFCCGVDIIKLMCCLKLFFQSITEPNFQYIAARLCNLLSMERSIVVKNDEKFRSVLMNRYLKMFSLIKIQFGNMLNTTVGYM